MHRFTVRSRPARLAALGAAALLTLTGCLQADMGITLNDDESGEFRIRTVINREQFAEIEEMFGGMMETGESVAPQDPCEEMLAEDMSTDELPPGAVVEPIDDGEWCGALATIPFADLDEFAELSAEFSESSEDDDSMGLGAPSIVKTDGGYRFEVTGLALSDEEAGLGEDAGMGELTEMFERLLADMRISYDVTLPGNPIEHNADAVAGNRFQWTLEWGDTRTELFAETGPGEPDGGSDTGELVDTPAGGGDSAAGSTDDGDDGSSLTWLWILLGVVAVGVIGFVIYKTTKRGSGPKPDGVSPVDGAAASTGAEAAAGTPPPPPPPPAPPAPPAPTWQPPSEH